jgi:hypothetical protein
VDNRDEDGSTPLHELVKAIARIDPQEKDRALFRLMIDELLSALDKFKREDDVTDRDGKSPWDYAKGDKYQWIRDLREKESGGARAAASQTVEQLVTPIDETEAAACRKSDTILAQFYIANDGREDSLKPLRPDVYTVIYDQQYGIEKLFDRSRSLGQDKRATCRWIHLPANNVSRHTLPKYR